MKSILKYAFLTTLLQSIIYVILLLTLEFFQENYFPTYYIINLKAALTYVEILIFIMILIGLNFSVSIVNKNWFNWVAFPISILYFIYFFRHGFESETLKLTLLYIIASGVLSSRFILEKKIKSIL